MNTIQSIAQQINSFASKFQLAPDQVEVTSYEQMGENVRVFYRVDLTKGKSVEEIKKMARKYRLANTLISDPFANGGTGGDVDPEAPTVAPTSITASIRDDIEVGQTFDIDVTVLPADASDKTFTVTASPAGIVTLINGGTAAIANNAGSVELTITSNVDAAVKVTKIINVAPAVIKPTSIAVAVQSAQFSGTDAVVNDTFTVSATMTPGNADANVTWSVSPEGIVMDAGEGEYLCEAEGTVTITATSVVDPTVSGSVTINVTA